MKLWFSCLIGLAVCQNAGAQDKLVFQEKEKSYFTETILPSIKSFNTDNKGDKKVLGLDLKGKKLLNKPSEYTHVWHNAPVSQGSTGTCWCFSTTSFYESEVKRLTGREIKLSEMFIVYWEYVERAKYFVQHRGNMYFGEGSEANAVGRMMELYGAVPRSVYEGKPTNQPFYTHDSMYAEIYKYLQMVKKTYAWDEDLVVQTVKSILNHHMGEIPRKFKYNGIDYSPMSFMEQVMQIQPANYTNIMSLLEKPFNAKAEYDVPDNWWNSHDYWNVNLENFMAIIQKSMENGYSVAIGGDVSEIGLVRSAQIGIIPSFDILSKNIDDNARQFRFSNGSTTDDHAMHIVGFQKVKGETWYLVKDSGSGSRTCGEGDEKFGYYFFSEDYIKLKIMNITVHKDALNFAGLNLE